MHIAILSSNANLYSTRRICEAIISRGHTYKVMHPMNFSILVEPNNPTLTWNNRPLEKFDAVIPRIGTSITFFGTAVVRQFEQMGVFCLNSAYSIQVSRDKLRCIQHLSRHPIGMPKTAFVKHKKGFLKAIEDVGGSPVIIKLLEGTQGIGVILADNTKIAEAIIETLQTTKQNVLIQSFVKESKGKDIRAFVVGGRVVAAMRRKAKGDEFRSNVHRGASVEPIKLDGEYESTAIRAAQVLGLHVAGVDMLEGKDGPMVMEVNSSPGLEGIERATHVDIGDAIVQYIEQQVLFPDLDIRQKLTLQKEYGVAEFQLSRDSALCGKPLQGSGLREKDILVLNIQRGTLNIPNPRSTRQLMANDVLLCFGSLLAMRSLVHVGVVPHKLDTPAPPTRGGRRRRTPATA